MTDLPASDGLLGLTAEIVAAHVGDNEVALAELPTLSASVHTGLASAGAPAEPEAPPQQPAVSIRSSIKPDHIVSLVSGRKVKLLKRYLRTNYDMTPDDYRRKWDLPSDYHMVAPAYAERRRGIAKSFGLGRKQRGVVEVITEAAGEPVAAIVEAVAPKKPGKPRTKAPAKRR